MQHETALSDREFEQNLFGDPAILRIGAIVLVGAPLPFVSFYLGVMLLYYPNRMAFGAFLVQGLCNLLLLGPSVYRLAKIRRSPARDQLRLIPGFTQMVAKSIRERLLLLCTMAFAGGCFLAFGECLMVTHSDFYYGHNVAAFAVWAFTKAWILPATFFCVLYLSLTHDFRILTVALTVVLIPSSQYLETSLSQVASLGGCIILLVYVISSRDPFPLLCFLLMTAIMILYGTVRYVALGEIRWATAADFGLVILAITRGLVAAGLVGYRNNDL